MKLKLVLPLALLALLLSASPALAKGGHYVFDGGTAKEQSQVRLALNVSSFNWSVVPWTITVKIRRGLASSEATPGTIWLDANLLDAGSFAWGVVQHEYAHQVDFSLMNNAVHAQLLPLLGGTSWFDAAEHGDNGGERFASTLVWSYWPSAENCMRPTRPGDEGGAMKPKAFKALMAQLLPTLTSANPQPAPIQTP